jgi:PHS family inorganic phosphate transporter-like MFS transporter
MGGDSKSRISTSITAMANFSSQYNFQSIAVAMLMMSQSQCTLDDDACKDGTQATWVSGASSGTVFVGAIVGQLTMGYLGDYFSRNLALCWTLILAGVASILSAVASYGSPEDVYGVIIAFRFVLGVGLGGVYPLAATKASEDAAESGENHNDAPPNSQAAGWSYFWQLPGFFVPWFFGYCFTYSSMSTSSQWRLVLALGCIPCFLTVGLLLLEAQLKYNNMWSILVASSKEDKNKSGEAHPQVTFAELKESLNKNDNGRKLFLVGLAWFLFDVVMYGIALLTGKIIEAMEDDDNVSSDSGVRNTAAHQMIAATVTIIVGFFSIALISHLGLQKLQTISFLIVAFFSLLLASTFEYLNHYDKSALFALYCLTYASLNFALGATTYAYPAAVFPRKIRSTYNGIASACGKVGAATGAFTFIYLVESPVGYSGLLGICSFVAILGATVTWFMTQPGDIRDMYTMQDMGSSGEQMIADDSDNSENTSRKAGGGGGSTQYELSKAESYDDQTRNPLRK